MGVRRALSNQQLHATGGCSQPEDVTKSLKLIQSCHEMVTLILDELARREYYDVS
jgi:hypothetical protein